MGIDYGRMRVNDLIVVWDTAGCPLLQKIYPTSVIHLRCTQTRYRRECAARNLPAMSIFLLGGPGGIRDALSRGGACTRVFLPRQTLIKRHRGKLHPNAMSTFF